MARKTEAERIRGLFDQLIQAPLRQFPSARVRVDGPCERGVYIIYDPKGHVLHVGGTPHAARGIAQRLNDHLDGASSFTKYHFRANGRHQSELRGTHAFRCMLVLNPRERALLEAYAIGHLCPAHIGHGRE